MRRKNRLLGASKSILSGIGKYKSKKIQLNSNYGEEKIKRFSDFIDAEE